MRKFLFILLMTLLTLPALAGEAAAESTYDRVVRTKTLRCAYTAYPTFVQTDEKTNKLYGMFYDLVEEMGRRLELKIEWVEEIGSDKMLEGLKAGRYDAVCSGHAATPTRAWDADFTKPLVFIPVYMYVRANESRFQDLQDINNSNATIVVLEGKTSQPGDFPLAQIKKMPLLTNTADRVNMVLSGQADATPLEPFIAAEYMAAHPEGKIKILGTAPLRMPPASIVIPTNEFALKGLLDTTIEYMLRNGVIKKIVKEHEKYTGAMYIPAPSSVSGEK